MNYLEKFWNNITASAADFLPATLGAILILVIGWLIARFIKKLITNLLKRTQLDERLGSDKINISRFAGKLIYFLIMIFVFMLALEKLGMREVMDPMKNMLDGFLSYIPNIIGAALVGYIGYMLATIVSELVELSGETIQSLVPKFKLPENLNLVLILKKIVFILIFIPLLIAALKILKIDAISEPATAMLETFLNAIPNILVAAIIMIVFVIGGKFITGLLKDLLYSMNLNEFFKKISLDDIAGKTDVVKLIGNIVYAFIVIFGLVTAMEKLEFAALTEILETVIEYGGKILFGLVILAIGNWISIIAKNSLKGKEDNIFVASVVRVAILAIFLAIGLRAMGIADEIINLAFGITLATVAVTIALSFGLGGREAGGKQMERILKKFNKKD